MTRPICATHLLEFIESRRSIGQLVEPAPSKQELEQALQAALSAPDHHRLRPWRFFQIQKEARQALGQVFIECLIESGVNDPVQHERARAQPLRAPLILLAVVNTQNHPKVPKVEQVLSMGAAMENFLLMLNAQGYAAMWRTGALAESQVLKQKLGLKQDDEIAGFVYIGTPTRELAARERLNVREFLFSWPESMNDKSGAVNRG
ncbi:nitroreductase [Alkanindiges sp. WGS2144]|uniref:nitroreductase family protein n=1 Tax=Alkanindiges sp. WGS2144 TaxID=3366808 RepID=UPI0037502A37